MATSNVQEVNVDDVDLTASLKTSGDKKTKLKIALIGETESGKSSFINAIRGLQDDSKYAAGTGIVNKTTIVKSYAHPLNRDVTLWDHPGLDTFNTDINSYFSTFHLKGFDAFLLFIKGNPRRTDQDLANKLDSMNKPFFLIRTKIDNDLPSYTSEEEREEILKKIKENALQILGNLKNGDGKKKLFLISNRDPENWDFGRLKLAILDELQSVQVEIPSASKKEDEHVVKQIESIDKVKLLDNIRKKMEDFAHEVGKKGLEAAKKNMEKTLGKWNETAIKLAVVGTSGVGKSSFINAIRGLSDDHPDAAKTGTVEGTKEEKFYPYPANPLITLWDLPGVGSKIYPDLKTYRKKFKLRNFDVFVIIAATRFAEIDGELAKTLKSMNKPFLFVRTKIDLDCQNEKRKEAFNEETMLKDTRKECSDNLTGLLLHDNDIYLISNHHKYKWDFPRLVQAILNQLSLDKQVCFVFSMYVVSESILNEKVKRLRGRIWRVALKSILKSTHSKEKSRTYDLTVIQGKVQFYLFQLGFPEEDSEQFKKMSEELQKEVRKFYLTSEVSVESYLKTFVTRDDNKSNDSAFSSWLNEDKTIDELQWLKDDKGIRTIFGFVHYSLNCVLDEMSRVSLKVLREKLAIQSP